MALSTTNTIPLETEKIRKHETTGDLHDHCSNSNYGVLKQVVFLSPGGRFELLQVLVTKTVVSWQIYQSPGVALNKGGRVN